MLDRLFDAKKENVITYNMFAIGFRLSDDNLQYFIERLEGKKYHFCKVRFDENSNKLYTYVTKDRSITIGDTVTIPTGNICVPDSKVLQVVDVFDSSLDKLDFPVRKLRCVERKLKSIVCPHCGAPIEINTGKKLGRCTKCHAEFYFLN